MSTSPAPVPRLRTDRLLLREWRPGDLVPFAALNADPVVMEHFPAPLTRDESDAMVARIERRWTDGDPSLWAVEVPGVVDFAGFVGLLAPDFDAPFTPCVEVGWRLAAAHWGRGYATEAARAAMWYGFERLGLAEVVSFTVPANARSRRVMDKIGLRHDPADDFDHPTLAEGSSFRRHVLYRVDADTWRRHAGAAAPGAVAAPGPVDDPPPSTQK